MSELEGETGGGVDEKRHSNNPLRRPVSPTVEIGASGKPTSGRHRRRELDALRIVIIGTAFLIAVGAVAFLVIGPHLPGRTIRSLSPATESTALATLRDIILLSLGALSGSAATAGAAAIRNAQRPANFDGDGDDEER